MQKRILFAVLLTFIACSFTSCEKLSGCKVCKEVTYENNAVISETAETEYCGAELIAKEATKDVNIGQQTIKVECR